MNWKRNMSAAIPTIKAETPKAVPPLLQDGEVDKFISRRVCSRCYADLQKRPVSKPRGWEVYCYFCGDAWGFTTVSRSYAVRLGQQALADRFEARQRFVKIVPNPIAGQKPEQIIHDLGF